MKIVYLGVKGILNTKRNGNDSVIVLGVGSATYHTNIKYWAQIGTNSLLPQKKSDLILDWR
jgi:hypothetical protein